MNWSRLNRALTSNGLLLKGDCGGINPMQRLTRPSTRLFSQTGQCNGRNFSSKGQHTQPERTSLLEEVVVWGIPLISVVGAVAYYLHRRQEVAHFEYLFANSVAPPKARIAEHAYVNRTKEKARLRELIMRPFFPSSGYYVYLGPHRAGKSQAILEVVDELRKEGVKGVHYVRVTVPLYDAIADRMAMTSAVMDGPFGFSSRTQDTDTICLEEVISRLAASAKKFDDNRRTTIILDGVNKIANAELFVLLEAAKLHADHGTIQWILVDSAGHGLDAMEKFSASSRMRTIFSRDVGEKEAKEFLKRSFEAAGKKFDADEVYKCATGDRIGLLNDAHESVKTASTQADLITNVTTQASMDLTKVFASWPTILNKDKAIFQYRILRLLAENPADVEDISYLRERAKDEYFLGKGVDCRSAIDELLKADLLRDTGDVGKVQLHSNAVKYLVLKNERDPFVKSCGDRVLNFLGTH